MTRTRRILAWALATVLVLTNAFSLVDVTYASPLAQAPTPTPAPTPAGKARIEMPQFAGNGDTVYAEVRNTGDGTATAVQMQVEAYVNGQLVARGSRALGYQLQAGGITATTIRTDEPVPSGADIRWNAQWRTTQQPLPKVEVSNVTAEPVTPKDYYPGWWNVGFTVANRDTVPFDGPVRFVVAVYDPDGHLVQGPNYLDEFGPYDLKPGESRKTGQTITTGRPDLKTVTVRVFAYSAYPRGGVAGRVLHPQYLAGGSADIALMNSAGQAISGYEVRKTDQGGFQIETILTDKYALVPDTYDVKATVTWRGADNKEQSATETRSVVVRPAQIAQVTFFEQAAATPTPQPSGKIYCTVKAVATGVALVGAEVRLVDGGKTVASVKTDASGNCSFGSLSDRTYTVVASYPGYADLSKQLTPFFTQTVEVVPFPLEVASDAGAITGAILSALDRKPLRNIPVDLMLQDALTTKSTRLATARTDASGHFEFKPLNAGTYVVFPDSLDYEVTSKVVFLSKGKTENVEILLSPYGADISLSMDSPAKAPLNKDIVYTLKAANRGPNPATVTLGVDLKGVDANIASYVSGTTLGGACELDSAARTLRCPVGKMNKSDTADVKLTLRPVKPGSVILSASTETSERDVDFNNNFAKATTEIEPFTIEGSVVTASPFLATLPIKRVPVTLRVDGAVQGTPVYTDEQGKFSFKVEKPAQTYQMETELKDKDGIIVIHSQHGFNNGIVKLAGRRTNLAQAHIRSDLIFFPVAGVDPAMTPAMRMVLQDAGMFYYNELTAVDFSRNTLKLKFDYKLPVDIYIHSNVAGVFYLPTDSHINVQRAGGKSSVVSNDTPDNREFHEFGHHVQADSAMGGENASPPRKTGETNHGGADNERSVDSVTEGFAEFYALLVKGSPVYHWAGIATNLQANFYTIGAAGKPFEEFNVASLLWDIVDKDNEPGDYISLGVEKTWKLLNSASITDVHSIYEALRKEVGNQDTNKADGLDDVDALFVLHKFYSDKNDNGVRDPGEAIGYADYWNPKTAIGGAPRRDLEPIPGTLLAFTARNERGERVSVPFFRVDVTFPPDQTAYNYTYTTRPDIATGHVRLFVPMQVQKVTLTALAPGYIATPITFLPQDFWQAVGRAQAAGSDVFQSVDIALRENGVAAPRNLRAQAGDPGAATLTWEHAGQVVLVRSLGREAASPDEGEAVYRGTANTAGDRELLTDALYYYTLFGVEGENFSRGVSVPLFTGRDESLGNQLTEDAKAYRELVTPPAGGPPPSPAGSGQAAGVAPQQATGRGISPALVGLLVVVVVVLGIGAALLVRGRRRGPPPGG